MRIWHETVLSANHAGERLALRVSLPAARGHRHAIIQCRPLWNTLERLHSRLVPRHVRERGNPVRFENDRSPGGFINVDINGEWLSARVRTGSASVSRKAVAQPVAASAHRGAG